MSSNLHLIPMLISMFSLIIFCSCFLLTFPDALFLGEYIFLLALLFFLSDTLLQYSSCFLPPISLVFLPSSHPSLLMRKSVNYLFCYLSLFWVLHFVLILIKRSPLSTLSVQSSTQIFFIVIRSKHHSQYGLFTTLIAFTSLCTNLATIDWSFCTSSLSALHIITILRIIFLIRSK